MYRRSAEVYDALYGYKDYAGEAVRVRELVEARKPGARSLLDVACGTGKHLDLFRQWYEVEGLDFSAEQLAVARDRLGEVPLHEADMASFDLGRRFDAVTCLFSAVGSLTSIEALDSAAAAMARHAEPGGVVIVEPWITPEEWRVDDRVHALFVDEPQLKVARMNVSERHGDLSVMEMHHLVGRPGGVEHFVERFELYLFTHEQYLAAFEAAGLAVEHDEEGLIGRGLYIGVAPT